MKSEKNQRLVPRKPRQQRALHKVELILEAAMRLLEQGGHAALNTNAIAATAGVSIGTLYQYFPDKDAILDTLAGREVEGMSKRVMAVMEDAAPLTPRARIAGVMRAVTAGYGARGKVHRLVMEHSMGRGSRKLMPLIEGLMRLLTSSGAQPLSRADAFVRTYAFVGVMRAMIAGGEAAPPRAEIEEALARLMSGGEVA